MPKRKNRLKPIQHEINQLDNLKSLEPIATAPEALALSDALIDIAVDALREVYKLEEGQEISMLRLKSLSQRVGDLPLKVVGS